MDGPLVLAGDFNTRPDEGWYTTHMIALGLDVTIPLRRSCRAPECGTNIAPDGSREWIDYVFLRRLEVTSTAVRLENRGLDDPYSDHDGLLVQLLPVGVRSQP